MGFMNFLKLGGKHIAYTTEKPKMTYREAVTKIHAMICCVDDPDEPLAIRLKFEKIDVAKYTDAQCKRIITQLKAILNKA